MEYFFVGMFVLVGIGVVVRTFGVFKDQKEILKTLKSTDPLTYFDLY
jgi:hypothetical protein